MRVTEPEEDEAADEEPEAEPVVFDDVPEVPDDVPAELEAVPAELEDTEEPAEAEDVSEDEDSVFWAETDAGTAAQPVVNIPRERTVAIDNKKAILFFISFTSFSVMRYLLCHEDNKKKWNIYGLPVKNV